MEVFCTTDIIFAFRATLNEHTRQIDTYPVFIHSLVLKVIFFIDLKHVSEGKKNFNQS